MSGKPASSTARYPASATARSVPGKSVEARPRTVYSWSSIWSGRTAPQYPPFDTPGGICPSLSSMKPLGIGIVGTGNIAGQYATDILAHPEIKLVAATDLDASRAAAFGEEHGCRIHGSLDDLLADPAVDIVVNLTVHQ